jgi:hypothetical protein
MPHGVYGIFFGFASVELQRAAALSETPNIPCPAGELGYPANTGMQLHAAALDSLTVHDPLSEAPCEIKQPLARLQRETQGQLSLAALSVSCSSKRFAILTQWVVIIENQKRVAR